MFAVITGSIIVASAITLETCNYIYHTKLLKFAKKKRYFNNNTDEYNILENMNEIELRVWISESISYNCAESIDKYYNNVPIESVPRNKMLKLICYYLYFKSMWQLTDDQIKYGKENLIKIEDKLKITFQDINDPNIYFLKFGNNELECNYRPLVMHSCLNIIKRITYANAQFDDFIIYEMKESKMKYLFYHNPNSDVTNMFIHGLGIGITPYFSYLKELKKLGSVIAPILPNLSNMEYCSMFGTIDENTFFPSYQVIRDDFKDMLKHHGVSDVNIISHSFGTIILGILLKDDELCKTIGKKVFIDPVCFVDQSFKIFKYINEQENSGDGVVNSVFNILVYNDIYIRYITQRFLYGPEFWILDYNKLNNNKSLVVLSTKDCMVPSNSIYEKCKQYDVPCFMINGANHADVFLLDEFRGVWSTIISFIDI
jgi:hypothetical protein